MRKAISHTTSRRGYHLIIDAVPAWVCEQCGELLFEENTVDAIQAVLQEVDRRLEESSLLLAEA